MNYDNDFRDPSLDPGHAMFWYWSWLSWLWRWLRSCSWQMVMTLMMMKRMYGNDNHDADADAVDDAQMMLWTMPRFEHFARIHWVLPRANAETFQLPRGVPHHKSLSSQGTFLQYLHIFYRVTALPKFASVVSLGRMSRGFLLVWCQRTGERIDAFQCGPERMPSDIVHSQV